VQSWAARKGHDEILSWIKSQPTMGVLPTWRP
jgi:hypothetical protein